ncbi:MAG: hypothetical protein JEZ06_03430 [Anaerolineaceae bacterium]|nr:hypothetical protein [Anaerolineaceae bacterium]
MVEKSFENENKFDVQMVLTIIIAFFAGLWITGLVLPGWLPGLRQSIVGEDVKMYWYVSRSSAILAYVFLWFSMILGLLLSNRIANIWLDGRITNEFHNFFSLLGLLFSGLHAFILMGDAYLSPNFMQIIAPFGLVSYKPFWVGLGQIGLYLWVMLMLSFYFRKGLGQAGWRLVHYSSFLSFILVILHGIFSGSDSGSTGMVTLYWVSAASTLFFVIFRIIAALFPYQREISRKGV